MLFMHLILLLIGVGAILVTIYDRDEVHNLAALSAGSIALIWGFVASPLAVKLLMSMAALGMCFRFKLDRNGL